MKKLLSLLVATFLIFGIAGCSNGDSSDGTAATPSGGNGPNPVAPVTVKVESISIASSATEFQIGEKSTITLTVTPTNATFNSSDWTVTAVEGGEVNDLVTLEKAKETLKVTGKKEGKVKVSCAVGEVKSNEIELTIKPIEKGSGSFTVTVSKFSELKIEVGTATSDALPLSLSGVEFNSVKWLVDGVQKATTNTFSITKAMAAGNVVVTAVAAGKDGKTYTANVTVKGTLN